MTADRDDTDRSVRLWLARNGDSQNINDWFTDKLECDDVPYIARTVADDEARESRLKAAEAECAAREDVQARLIKERNAAERERDEAARERDEARDTNARLHRRCQKAEALAKWDDVGLARALVSMLTNVRHRYALLRSDAAHTRDVERRHVEHVVGVMREWIRNGRPTNHTAGKEADALVDEAIAAARERDRWRERAEKAEQARAEGKS